MPLVLAINLLHRWGVDDDDIVDALFGSEQVVVDVTTRTGRPSRARDGLFMGRGGPINTRVSAVLITSVQPWTAARAGIEVFLNPWSKVPVPDGALPFRLRRVINNTLTAEEGVSPGDVLGLSSGWPEEYD